jgi:hypothetical protein
MSRQSISALVAALLAIAAAAQIPGPAARYDAWTIIGPGGVGRIE